MIKRIGHIGIAVRDLHETLKIYKQVFGLEPKTVKTVEKMKLKIAFIPVGDGEIELLQPLGTDGSIAEFIASRGGGIHHIAIITDNIIAEMERMKELNVKFIDEKPRIGAHGVPLAFISPQSAHGVTIELCEE